MLLCSKFIISKKKKLKQQYKCIVLLEDFLLLIFWTVWIVSLIDLLLFMGAWKRLRNISAPLIIFRYIYLKTIKSPKYVVFVWVFPSIITIILWHLRFGTLSWTLYHTISHKNCSQFLKPILIYLNVYNGDQTFRFRFTFSLIRSIKKVLWWDTIDLDMKSSESKTVMMSVCRFFV